MIHGQVTGNLDPVIDVGLIEGENVETVSVVIDTGFNGGLCLSIRHFGLMDLYYLYAGSSELADGRFIAEDIYTGRIIFDGGQRQVEVTLTDSADSLIGAELLKDRTLFIDYPACEVRIE